MTEQLSEWIAGLDRHEALFATIAAEVSALESRLAAAEARVAALVEGQEMLRQQTVRIRNALGGVTREGNGTLIGDTEQIAKDVVAENKRLREALQKHGIEGPDVVG